MIYARYHCAMSLICNLPASFLSRWTCMFGWWWSLRIGHTVPLCCPSGSLLGVQRCHSGSESIDMHWIHCCVEVSLNNWGRDKMDTISQTTFVKCIFLNENVWTPIKISLKFVPKSPINNIPALVQIMAWCRPGDKPLSEPMMVWLPTHICVTRPQC